MVDEVFEKLIQLIQNRENKKQETRTFFMINTICGQNVYNNSVRYLNSKKEQYGRDLGFYKKALNIAIKNKTCQAFKELLKQFIEIKQIFKMSCLVMKLDFSIENPLQYKRKERLSNKRYLSVFENNLSNKSNDVRNFRYEEKKK
ncbi:hypothetical protein C1645_835080 [Glomus cerebriforme]|uniref:Uncharacterized protein n=1 Tax=Glomus cerebriforme TaxID=658196 RepID=A0A397S8F9_9GLOM|nr:hypothetical protein C1645_835080 [Glomus cerebriforme]